MSELGKDKINSRSEVHIPITLKGLYKGYQKIFFDTPTDAYEWMTRKLEAGSKKMMSGLFSAVTLPLGIMVRNASTVAHDTMNEDGRKFGWIGSVGAAAGAMAAWWMAGSLLFAKLAVAGTVSKIVAIGGAAVLTAPIIAPALAAGVILASTVMGVGAFALSTLPAVANLRVGILRTWDSIRGVKYDKETLDALHKELSKDSISTRHEQKKYDDAVHSVMYLPKDGQMKIFESLKSKFAVAAEQGLKEQAVAAAKKQEPDAPKL